MMRKLVTICVLVGIILMTGCGNKAVESSEYERLKSEYARLELDYETLQNKYTLLQRECDWPEELAISMEYYNGICMSLDTHTQVHLKMEMAKERAMEFYVENPNRCYEITVATSMRNPKFFLLLESDNSKQELETIAKSDGIWTINYVPKIGEINVLIIESDEQVMYTAFLPKELVSVMSVDDVGKSYQLSTYLKMESAMDDATEILDSVHTIKITSDLNELRFFLNNSSNEMQELDAVKSDDNTWTVNISPENHDVNTLIIEIGLGIEKVYTSFTQ